MKKIVYLPLDERPCNYNFVAFLCEGNKELKLVRPKLSELGHEKTPADYSKIEGFLLRECLDADYLILSVDMLLYGGIVPSRLHHLDKDELESRLFLLNVLKRRNAKMKIYAFSLIMRCPCYSSNEEEPDYYGICGEEIFLYGQNEHKFALGKIDSDEYRENRVRLSEKCVDYLGDFLTRRKINLSMVIKTLELVGNVIDKFIIPQDDSNPIGYTAMDQAVVKEYIANHNLKVDIYPGADEAGLTLLARVVIDIKGYKPVIAAFYPKKECRKIIPTFEDREVYKSICAQIENAGAVLVEGEGEEDADILMYCNLPVGEMKNTMFQFGESYDKRDLPAFIERICKHVRAGKLVAVSDQAYLNGGDKELTERISEKVGILSLAGYAGWNTSSNTLGTVICQSIMRYFYGATPAHRRFTALRVYEDVAYDSEVRRHIAEDVIPPMGYDYTRLDGERGVINDMICKEVQKYMDEHFPEVTDLYEIADCYMPWNRTFEIGLVIEEK